MLKTKTAAAINIPSKILKKLSLKDGAIVKAKIEKGKLFIVREKDEPVKIMKYAGIWKDEDVENAFREIRRDWSKWTKSLHV